MLLRASPIPFVARFDLGLEIVANHLETRSLGWLDIPATIFPCWVGVIHDKPLFGGKAGIDEALLPRPGLQHVQVDSDVCVEEPFPAEGGLPRALNADKDDGFHNTLSDAPGGSRIARNRKQVFWVVRATIERFEYHLMN